MIADVNKWLRADSRRKTRNLWVSPLSLGECWRHRSPYWTCQWTTSRLGWLASQKDILRLSSGRWKACQWWLWHVPLVLRISPTGQERGGYRGRWRCQRDVAHPSDFELEFYNGTSELGFNLIWLSLLLIGSAAQVFQGIWEVRPWRGTKTLRPWRAPHESRILTIDHCHFSPCPNEEQTNSASSVPAHLGSLVEALSETFVASAFRLQPWKGWAVSAAGSGSGDSVKGWRLVEELRQSFLSDDNSETTLSSSKAWSFLTWERCNLWLHKHFSVRVLLDNSLCVHPYKLR